MGTRADERLEFMAVGQSGSSDPDGGFLVPDFFQRELIMSEQDEQPWLALRNQFIVPAGFGDIVTPQLSDRDRSGGDVGGVELQRLSETGTIALSTMVFTSR